MEGTWMAQQPTAKRVRMTKVSDGDGDTGGEGSSPWSSKLRPTFFVVLFAMRMSEMSPVPARRTMFQRYPGRPRKYQGTFSRQTEAGLLQELIRGHRQIESLLHEMVRGSTQTQDLLHEVVRTQRQHAHLISNLYANQNTRLEPNQELSAATEGTKSNTNICLRFSSNNFKLPVYTDKNVKDENNASIKVAIYEGDKKITSGPLSKENIEILVLRGDFLKNGHEDWSEEEFDNHIEKGREGQVLMGTMRLTNGEVELSHIRFKEPTYGRKPAFRVQEAIMNPVVVKHRRNEANEKRYPPRLDDDVFRLEEISKNGHYQKRLKKANICNVQEFLKAFIKDPNKLREILKMETQNDSWSKVTSHARQCVLEDRQELKRYQSEEGNVGLFFNCVHDLVGAEFRCGYVARGDFNPAQQTLVNKLKGRAYDNLEDIASDYVIKGNAPQRISPSTDAAAGPSVQAVASPQPIFSAEHLALAASEGVRAAESSPHGDINHITTTIYPNSNIDGMMTPHPGHQNINDYQDHGIILDSIMPGWQQTLVDPVDQLTFGYASTNVDGFQVPMPGEGVCFGFTMGAIQPSSAEHGQGPRGSAFPGYGPSNDCQ